MDPYTDRRPDDAANVPVAAPLVPTVRSRARVSGSAIVLAVAAIVAAAGVAFAVGRLTAPAAPAAVAGGGGFRGGAGAGASFAAGGFGGGGGGAGGFGGVAVQGTVTSVDAGAITLQLTSGQSVTIPTDASTTYHGQTPAKATDVKSGSKVSVEVSGGGRGFRGAGGSPAAPVGTDAGGSPAPRPSGGLGTARDVTIVAP